MPPRVNSAVLRSLPVDNSAGVNLDEPVGTLGMGVDTLRNRDTVRPPVNQTRLGNEVKSLIKLRTHALNGSWNTVVDFRQDICIRNSVVMKTPCEPCRNLS